MCREDIIAFVVKAVRAQIKDPSASITESTALENLRGFDSLFVVGLLERMEDHFGIEMNPALILPETFETPATIAEALLESK